MQWNPIKQKSLLWARFCALFVLLVLCFSSIPIQATDTMPTSCYLGGMPFGVKLQTKGVFVAGVSEVETPSGRQNPAYDAGIRQKDIILKVNGKEVNTVTEVTKAIGESGGQALTFSLERDGATQEISVVPIKDQEGQYRCGLWIRDHTAGIGTVTFILPDTNAFAGLGHGICDSDTGELMPLLRGSVCDVAISGIVKGSVGHPGELKGYFQGQKTGSLLGNTRQGVFGIFANAPEGRPLLPIGHPQDVVAGDASLFCTLGDGSIHEYHIQISKIREGETKNFVVEVTDPALIEQTGGIVQGMSGSPIVQNGKVIGAVTHVLINDPQKGYGIFIDNMLAQMPHLLK